MYTVLYINTSCHGTMYIKTITSSSGIMRQSSNNSEEFFSPYPHLYKLSQTIKGLESEGSRIFNCAPGALLTFLRRPLKYKHNYCFELLNSFNVVLERRPFSLVTPENC